MFYPINVSIEDYPTRLVNCGSCHSFLRVSDTLLSTQLRPFGFGHLALWGYLLLETLQLHFPFDIFVAGRASGI